MVVPVTQIPILDYMVSEVSDQFPTEGTQMFEITIHSYGATPAKNVVVSISAENTDFRVLGSRPFLADAVVHNVTNATADSNQIGKSSGGN